MTITFILAAMSVTPTGPVSNTTCYFKEQFLQFDSFFKNKRKHLFMFFKVDPNFQWIN